MVKEPKLVLPDLKLEGAKGQIISKCLLGVFNFFQKMNENMFDLRFHSSKVKFVFWRKRWLEKIVLKVS